MHKLIDGRFYQAIEDWDWHKNKKTNDSYNFVCVKQSLKLLQPFLQRKLADLFSLHVMNYETTCFFVLYDSLPLVLPASACSIVRSFIMLNDRKLKKKFY